MSYILFKFTSFLNNNNNVLIIKLFCLTNFEQIKIQVQVSQFESLGKPEMDRSISSENDISFVYVYLLPVKILLLLGTLGLTSFGYCVEFYLLLKNLCLLYLELLNCDL